jgi:hypothetical protein
MRGRRAIADLQHLLDIAASSMPPTTDRPQKITFAEMRESGVRGLLVYCANYYCSRSIAISGDQWPMRSAYPILSLGLFAEPAASAAPTKGRTSLPPSQRDNDDGTAPLA